MRKINNIAVLFSIIVFSAVFSLCKGEEKLEINEKEMSPSTLYFFAKGGGGWQISNNKQNLFAAKLATHAEGTPWIILLLTDRTAIYSPDYEIRRSLMEMGDKKALALIRKNDAAIIVNLLKNLPPQPALPVLLAITNRLDDSSHGMYLDGEKKDAKLIETKPVKDVAHQILKRVLKTDHGYDKEKWQEEILESRVANKLRKPDVPRDIPIALVIQGAPIKEIQKAVRESGKGIDSFRWQEGTLLFYAVEKERIDIARWALENGANPNGCLKSMLPLSAAIINENAEMVELLLKHGADPDRDMVGDGTTPRKIAIDECHNKKILSILSKYPTANNTAGEQNIDNDKRNSK